MKTKRDNDLTLIGIGRPGYEGFRKATDEEVREHEESKTTTFELDPAKIAKAAADKARLDELTGN